jgi:hypothetical protein
MTDTPGVWPIHCHIGWHLSEGKMAAVVIQPDTIKGFKQPPEWSGVSRCVITLMSALHWPG